MIDIGLYLFYALIVIAVVAAIGMPLVNAIQSPATFLKSLYGVIGLVVVFLIAYAVSSDAVTPQWAVQGISPGASKLVGAGLITFYVVIVVAVIGLIVSEINKAFN